MSWEEFKKGFDQTMEDISNSTAQAVDSPCSPFAAIGVKSEMFSCTRLKAGVDTMAEVGQTILEAPGTAIDGMSKGCRETKIGEIPDSAISGITMALRHEQGDEKRIPA
ncbi:hypothetical protein GUITHDRAFT_109940 [Guillardia theta CCMP2712]|uniref:Uncharacterized protein n=2 Tax=Guillardia theta TaxID=55529 RepID=L1J6K9_GUITC|nr:hypothetical protein GUITHDRAFT_109940 [Guillardia theta CCMP2712]EKX44156.1 hypothetical protein GUITHDRAFT_109940 [Guillardia theta CCMP2712]|eukprot:XP_005831136.1 hypothetical protein GUITHDRAFT_109940 [Guillardia theta CCMP2712]